MRTFKQNTVIKHHFLTQNISSTIDNELFTIEFCELIKTNIVLLYIRTE